MTKPTWMAHPNRWVKAWVHAEPQLQGKHAAGLRYSLVALADAIDRRQRCVWKTQKAMAGDWCIPLRTFERHLAKLEELGVIKREPRYRKHGELAGTRTSDRILFCPPPDD